MRSAEAVNAEVFGIIHEAFGDEKLFVEMLENNGFYADSTLYSQENCGKLSSIIFSRKYPMNFFGTAETEYLFCAATVPEMRGKGEMSSLLKSVLNKLNKKGSIFASLIPSEPSLFDYYSRFGFYSDKFISVRNYCGQPHSPIGVKCDNSKLYGSYFKKYSSVPFAVYKTEEQFIQAVDEYTYNETTDFFTDGDGFAFLNIYENSVVMREGVYSERFFGSAAGYYGKNVVVEDTLSGVLLPHRQPVGMTRIINVTKLCDIFVKKSCYDFSFEINDDIIKENNLAIGVCGNNVYHPDKAEKINIDEFSLFIHSLTGDGYMNAMLN